MSLAFSMIMGFTFSMIVLIPFPMVMSMVFIGGKCGNAFTGIENRQIGIFCILDHVIQEELHLQAILNQYICISDRLDITRFCLILVGAYVSW